MDCRTAFCGKEGAPAIFPLAVLIPAIINLTEAIVNLSIGEAYKDDCNISDVNWYLGAAGGVSMFIGLVKLVGMFTPCISNDKVTIPLACFFDLSYYILIIWGSIRVFSEFNSWNNTDPKDPNYCHGLPFNWVFSTLIVYWFLMPGIVFGGVKGLMDAFKAMRSNRQSETEQLVDSSPDV